MEKDLDLTIKGFLETSFLDWPGMISSVLFLAGCNFRCPFCHNYGLVLNHEAYPTIAWADVRRRLLPFRGWIDGVVITGGEPTLSPGLANLVRDVRELGFKVKLDTNGSRPSVLKPLLDGGLLDHVAMDVKASLNETSYARAAGKAGFLKPVLQSLELLRQAGIPYTLRTTVVPGLHSEDEVLMMAEQLRFAPEWTLQNFNPENALDCAFRDKKAWDEDFFSDLNRRAMAVHKGANKPG